MREALPPWEVRIQPAHPPPQLRATVPGPAICATPLGTVTSRFRFRPCSGLTVGFPLSRRNVKSSPFSWETLLSRFLLLPPRSRGRRGRLPVGVLRIHGWPAAGHSARARALVCKALLSTLHSVFHFYF